MLWGNFLRKKRHKAKMKNRDGVGVAGMRSDNRVASRRHRQRLLDPINNGDCQEQRVDSQWQGLSNLVIQPDMLEDSVWLQGEAQALVEMRRKGRAWNLPWRWNWLDVPIGGERGIKGDIEPWLVWLLEHRPMHWRLVGSIPDQGTYPGWDPGIGISKSSQGAPVQPRGEPPFQNECSQWKQRGEKQKCSWPWN